MRVAFPGAAEGVDMFEVLKGVKEDGSRRSIADACLTKAGLEESRVKQSGSCGSAVVLVEDGISC